jgi:hypothetical protein
LLRAPRGSDIKTRHEIASAAEEISFHSEPPVLQRTRRCCAKLFSAVASHATAATWNFGLRATRSREPRQARKGATVPGKPSVPRRLRSSSNQRESLSGQLIVEGPHQILDIPGPQKLQTEALLRSPKVLRNDNHRWFSLRGHSRGCSLLHDRTQKVRRINRPVSKSGSGRRSAWRRLSVADTGKHLSKA